MFSLYGLNCGLCTMRLVDRCPGCGQGNKPCKAARCVMGHNVEYCFQCSGYSCRIYNHADEVDSFITNLHRKTDIVKTKEIKIEAYSAEQAEKARLPETLLSEHNFGHEKTHYSALLPICL